VGLRDRAARGWGEVEFSANRSPRRTSQGPISSGAGSENRPMARAGQVRAVLWSPRWSVAFRK
jgi:hypothetical protein